jgi:hypothetical protein
VSEKHWVTLSQQPSFASVQTAPQHRAQLHSLPHCTAHCCRPYSAACCAHQDPALRLLHHQRQLASTAACQGRHWQRCCQRCRGVQPAPACVVMRPRCVPSPLHPPHCACSAPSAQQSANSNTHNRMRHKMRSIRERASCILNYIDSSAVLSTLCAYG